MPEIVRAVALAHIEGAFLAWELDQASIPGGLGCPIVPEHPAANDQPVADMPLAARIACKGQRHPARELQNTAVRPVSKLDGRHPTRRKPRGAVTHRCAGAVLDKTDTWPAVASRRRPCHVTEALR